MSGAIVPKTMDNGEWFKMDGTEREKRFSKGEGGVDDEVEGYYGNPRFLMEPLKVML